MCMRVLGQPAREDNCDGSEFESAHSEGEPCSSSLRRQALHWFTCSPTGARMSMNVLSLRFTPLGFALIMMLDKACR